MLYHLFMAVQEKLNFSYTYVESSMGKYGTKLDDGSWTGQIGALHKKEIDVSIMDLTITYDRYQVNFSKNLTYTPSAIFPSKS